MRDVTAKATVSIVLLALVAVFSACIAEPDVMFGPDGTTSTPDKQFVDPGNAMSSSVNIRKEERDALLAIYDSLGGDNWKNNGGWGGGPGWATAGDSVDVIRWFGIRADSDGRVVSLELRNNNLSGNLPVNELAKLRRLQRLYFCCNEITGTIDRIGSLSPHLYMLELGANKLTGGIDASIKRLRNLRELYLSSNQMDGTVHPDIGFLENLERLWLFENQLTQVPVTFGRLKVLRELFLGSNALTQPIPSQWSGMTSLEGLDVMRNRMTGKIPRNITNLKNLVSLRVGHNDFTGPMPDLSRFPKLDKFVGGWNQFTGPISDLPESLTYLNVQTNDLHGPLPSSPGRNLHTLRVMENPKVEGFVPLIYADRPWTTLDFRDSGVCIPPMPEYDGMRRAATSTWMSYESTRCVDAYIDRLSLNWIHDALDGGNWTNGWDLSDEPEDRAGITVTNGRVTGIELASTGLSGDIGDVFTWISELEDLDLSGNADLVGQLSDVWLGHSFTSLDLSGTGVCRPDTDEFESWIAGIGSFDGKRCADRKKAIIKIWPTMNQAIQRITRDPADQVPLIRGRDARLRVWVTANKDGVYEAPRLGVRVGNTRGGWLPLIDRYLDAPGGEVLHIDELDGGARSYDLTIPSDYIKPGLVVWMKLGDKLTPITEQTEWMEYKPVVVDVPSMKLTIVPVYHTSESTATKHTAIAFASNADHATSILKWSFPLQELVAAPHPTGFWTDHKLVGTDSDEWLLVMDLVWTKHDAGATGYWYAVSGIPGVRGVAESPGYATACVDSNGRWTSCSNPNVALIHGPGSSVSFGRPTATYLAHEVGHTLNLLHAPCRTSADVDPNFPYSDGTIGQWGYDFAPGSDWNVPSSTPDLMGYCTERTGRGGWLSDYHYEIVMAYRDTLSVAPDVVPMVSGGPAMVISGRIENGRIEIAAPMIMSDAKYMSVDRGPYQVDVWSDDGEVLFSGAMSTTQLAHSSETFMFTIPIEDGVMPAEIMVTGPDGASGLLQMAEVPQVTVVRSRSTGQIVGIFRNGPPPPQLTGPGYAMETGLSTRGR